MATHADGPRQPDGPPPIHVVQAHAYADAPWRQAASGGPSAAPVADSEPSAASAGSSGGTGKRNSSSKKAYKQRKSKLRAIKHHAKLREIQRRAALAAEDEHKEAGEEPEEAAMEEKPEPEEKEETEWSAADGPVEKAPMEQEPAGHMSDAYIEQRAASRGVEEESDMDTGGAASGSVQDAKAAVASASFAEDVAGIMIIKTIDIQEMLADLYDRILRDDVDKLKKLAVCADCFTKAEEVTSLARQVAES